MASADPDAPDAAHDLFGRASHYDTLWAAWEKVRANNGAAGADGVTVAAFAAVAPGRISRLAHELRAGRYRPGQSRRVYVPKRSGGSRPLDIPDIVDRVAQGAVALTLQPIIEAELEDTSFAYRPGRSVAQAVQRIASLRRQGYDHIVDGDIVRYFERVPHDQLIGKIERVVRDDRLVDLIALWLEHFAPHGVGLPQGSPLSPLLANFYLDAIDEAIDGRGVRLVRFADDFVLLCRDALKAKGALARMRELLDAHGLELHPEKTRIVPFDQGFRFLGHVFVRSMVWREVVIDETPAEDLVAAAEAVLAVEGADAAPAVPAESERAVSRGRWATRSQTLYMVEPGRRLDCEGETFVVRDREADALRLPHRSIDRVEVGPGCDIATAALDLAAATHTEIVRVNGRGEALGRWVGPSEAGRAKRQLAQAALVLDPGRRLAVARIIVAGRIHNQYVHLKRLNRTRNDADLSIAAVRLARIARLAEGRAGTIAEAMGREGQAAAAYWPALSRALDAGWSFAGRRIRREKADPVNIAFDVLSNLLARDVRLAVCRHGLQPGFGVLHAADDGEDALVYDLMEEFRAPLVEACALGLFARRALRREMFEKADDRWSLSREGWSALIRGYEAAAARAVRHPALDESMSWRGVIDAQAQAFARHCEGGAPYAPYRMDY